LKENLEGRIGLARFLVAILYTGSFLERERDVYHKYIQVYKKRII
jgi:hypothetical protein